MTADEVELGLIQRRLLRGEDNESGMMMVVIGGGGGAVMGVASTRLMLARSSDVRAITDVVASRPSRRRVDISRRSSSDAAGRRPHAR